MATAYFNPEGNRGEDSSAANSRQRRAVVALRPARRST
jgi:hypothetical protein